ncbi:MAG: PRC-barrel domain-containing protein [Patescibacteria group bacterium]
MLASSIKLHGIKVVTESGIELGRVMNMRINTDTQEIEQYEVTVIKKLIGKKLLIHRRQVVRLDSSQLIVEDGIEKEMNLGLAVE